ncbi:MAG: hypothetical protein HY332_10860 [Chloroflexi bacterium]|nr:hypothetical protein [Chloroflexota bacterium]
MRNGRNFAGFAGGRRVRRRQMALGTAVAITASALAGCGTAGIAGNAPATTAGQTDTSSGPPATARDTMGGAAASNVGRAAATQTSEGGQVTVKVTWPGPSAGPVFTVAMDTHSVDLDGYDLKQLAALRTDDGREVRPSAWQAPKGGHHREGQLTFPASLGNGTPLISPTTRAIELVIRDVTGVAERRFRWTL